GRLKNRQDLGGTSNVRPVDIHAIDANLSRRNTSVIDQIVHPIEATQKSRLSAPGRADERCYLFLWDLQTNTLQCLGIAITKVNLIDINNRSCNLPPLIEEPSLGDQDAGLQIVAARFEQEHSSILLFSQAPRHNRAGGAGT